MVRTDEFGGEKVPGTAQSIVPCGGSPGPSPATNPVAHVSKNTHITLNLWSQLDW